MRCFTICAKVLACLSVGAMLIGSTYSESLIDSTAVEIAVSVASGVKDAAKALNNVGEDRYLTNLMPRTITVDEATSLTIGDFYRTVLIKYMTDVCASRMFTDAYAYDSVYDEEYGGYSIRMLFDDKIYQCIWINPENGNVLKLYDCDITSPFHSHG